MQVPDFLPPMPDRDFWELHRLLADCHSRQSCSSRGAPRLRGGYRAVERCLVRPGFGAFSFKSQNLVALKGSELRRSSKDAVDEILNEDVQNVGRPVSQGERGPRGPRSDPALHD